MPLNLSLSLIRIVEVAMTANTGPSPLAAKLLWAEVIYDSPEIDKTL